MQLTKAKYVCSTVKLIASVIVIVVYLSDSTSHLFSLFGFSQLESRKLVTSDPISQICHVQKKMKHWVLVLYFTVAWRSLPNTNSVFPSTVDLIPCSSGVPLPGGLGAAVLLLLPEPRSPLLPGRRHRCALQQRAGEPAAPNLRRQRKESHCDGAQAGVYWGHALPPSQLCRHPGQGTSRKPSAHSVFMTLFVWNHEISPVCWWQKCTVRPSWGS